MDREPTEDQLRDAWRAVARPEWGSYDEAKAGWLHFSIARSRARLLANGVRPEPAPPEQPPAVAAPPQHWGSLRVTHPEPIVDRKRLAAGDRDD